jgi:hypothetical protein
MFYKGSDKKKIEKEEYSVKQSDIFFNVKKAVIQKLLIMSKIELLLTFYRRKSAVTKNWF